MRNPSTQLQPGQRLGNYRIELAVIGDSTGEVYHAVHQLLPRRAVVKVRASGQPFAIQMLREACILEALHHPGIVRVYESGLLPDRRPWFACELVEGPSISNILGPSAIERVDAVALLRDLAEVLEHAHRRGVIHCGLRPQRIALTGRSRGFPVCITDWSDARAHDAAPMAYAPSVASWHFTSPELARGDAIDDRVDVYALGVIAYQLLTGVLPFAGRAIATEGQPHDGTTQHMPTEVHCPDAPRELTQLVDQMLSHDQWDRPSTAEVQTELTWLLDTMAPNTPSLVRIRRPRWTPAIVFDELTPLPGDEPAVVHDKPAS